MDKLEELNKRYQQVVSKPSLDNLNKVSNRSSVSYSREGNNDPLVSLPATARSSAVDTDEVVVEREQDNLPTGVVQVFINGQTNPDGTPKATCWTNFQKVGGGYASSVNAVLENNKSFDTCEECLEDLIPPPPPEPVIDGIVRTFDNLPWELTTFSENKAPGDEANGYAFKITGTMPGSTVSNPIQVDSVTVSTTGPPSVSNPSADIYNCFIIEDDPSDNDSYIMRLANGKRQAYVSKQNDPQGPSGGDYDVAMTVTRGTQVVTFNLTIEITNVFDDEDPEVPGIYSEGGFTNKGFSNILLSKRPVFPWQGTNYSGNAALSSSSDFLNFNPSTNASSFNINSTTRMNVWGSTAWDAARTDNTAFVAQIARSWNGNESFPPENWDGGYRDTSGPIPNSRLDGLSYEIYDFFMTTCLVDITPNNAPQDSLTSFAVKESGLFNGRDNYQTYRPFASDFEIVTAGYAGQIGLFIRYKYESHKFGNGVGNNDGCLSWSEGLNYGSTGYRRAAVWMKFNIKVRDASRYLDGTGATPVGTDGPGSASESGFYVSTLVYKGDNNT